MVKPEPKKYGRGKHPNSLAALARSRDATTFYGETAVNAARSSAAVRRNNARLKRMLFAWADLEPFLDQLADNGYTRAIAEKLVEAAIRGNMTAIKILLRMEEESNKYD